MFVLTGAAFAVAMICYVLCYRQDKTAGYRTGTIPLTADGFTAPVFAGVMAVSQLSEPQIKMIGMISQIR